MVGRAAVPLAVALAAVPARAQHVDASHVEACASASEQGQQAVTARRLVAARTLLLDCARPTCPTAIERDCDELLSRVDAELPTVVLFARDAGGADLVDVRVLVDGSPIADHLDGRAIAIDPGSHTFRFVVAGRPPVDQQVVLHDGEKAREIAVRIGDAAARERAAPPRAGTKVPAAAYASGGVGAIALVAFGYLAVTGQADADRCTTDGCSRSQLDALDRKRVLAWTSLGVGVVAGAVAAWTIWRDRGGRRATIAIGCIDAGPMPAIVARGRF